MKINWGYKITIVYLVFAVGMMAMVYLATMQNRDLVAEDYYEQELAYQKVIDQSAQTAALSSAVSISRKGDELNIELPAEFKGSLSEGNWNLYYAADKQRDLHGDFHTANGIGHLKIDDNTKGQYLLKLQWQNNGIVYYYEENIFF